MEITEKLSYDDVLLKPGFSEILPGDVNVKTRLAGDIYLNVPIISAAMDTVTEDKLAIALALEGGAGVIHRNLSPDQQAMQVDHVKRYLNWIIDEPVTINVNKTMGDVRKKMAEHGVTGFPVLDGQKLVGIITNRDMRFTEHDEQPLQEVMTKKLVVERGIPTPETARKKFYDHRIEKLPVVDDKGHLTGLITVTDMEKKAKFPHAATDVNGRLIVGAAVSPNDWKIRIPKLLEHKCDFVVLDTAHGLSKNVLDAVRDIKKQYPITVIGGNVAGADGVKRLADAGADGIKIGVGPGSICTTRVIAGIGIPQFSAVMDAAEEAVKHDIPVIADGGIKFSGDIVKAIGGGASTVMIGNLFAGLKEAPGKEIIFDGRIFKSYRGMGSVGAIQSGSGDRYNMKEGEKPVPEGVEGRVPYKGELAPYLHQLVTGLKKGMGYTGCKNIEELQKYRKFVRISSAGLKESHSHDVSITQEPPNYSR